MRIKIENIGLIKDAEIDINGLTVITGENDSGKSTVGKLLFSIYSSLNNLDKNIVRHKISAINEDLRAIRKILRSNNLKTDINSQVSKLLQQIRYFDESEKEEYIRQIKELEYLLLQEDLVNAEIASILNDIRTEINLTKESNGTKKFVIQNVMKTEFNKQINNLFESDIAKVKISEGEKIAIKFFVKNNQVLDENFAVDEVSFSDVLYIDTTEVIDRLSYYFLDEGATNHIKYLVKKLITVKDFDNIVSQFVHQEKIEIINSQLSRVLKGDLTSDDGELVYKNNNKNINIGNLATGIKAFAIIKLLLDNNNLNSNALLIIDEPEIHLHPEWQIIYAELIVLLSIHIGISTLITSHSPYFIEAIELYSKKYNYAQNTKFYLAYKEGDSSAKIADITNDLQQTYKKLSKPFRDLESLAEELEENGCR